MKELIISIADEGIYFELQKDYAKNILIGFIRLNGETIGVVANQPLVLAGCLDIDSVERQQGLLDFVMLLTFPY